MHLSTTRLVRIRRTFHRPARAALDESVGGLARALDRPSAPPGRNVARWGARSVGDRLARAAGPVVWLAVMSGCGSRSVLDISGEETNVTEPGFDVGKGGQGATAGNQTGSTSGSGGRVTNRGGGSSAGGRPNGAGGQPGKGGQPNGRGGRLNVGGGGSTGTQCPMPPDVCLPAVDEGSARLCNGLDDDCDGAVDESCACVPGAVQACFAGPPGRRNVGACRAGAQQCVSNGKGGGIWGPCVGGISPSEEVCDNLDNDCNGCTDDLAGCDEPVGSCPGPGNPRVPDGRPLVAYPLKGEDFYSGKALFWSWKIEGGPCDAMPSGPRSFQLASETSRDATFTPRLSGDYQVRLAVITEPGEAFTCTFVVHVDGPGLRIEMCYPESEYQDLDLYLKQPGHTSPWFVANSPMMPNADQCDWHDCEATLRGGDTLLTTETRRADWGYSSSPLSECRGGPQGDQWANLGYCANPRLDIDNNLREGTGLPENINVDAPREGDVFRIMVQNFSGTLAHPIVNVHCGGHRVATLGAAPDELANFQSSSGASVGAMWRVADVTTHLDALGKTTCDVAPLHPDGAVTGYRLTVDDPSY